jgi:G3E family GTPase
VQDSDEQIVEMNNGCVCCTVRGDLIVALSELARKKQAGQLHFDRLVIETTGLANPGPVAQTFFVDDEVAASYMLDAVVTVVDAKHAQDQLDHYEESQRQVGFADKILLSKTDLVDSAALTALTTRLQHINPRAAIVTVTFGDAPLKEILDLRGFNLNDKLEIDPDFLRAEEHERERAEAHARGDHSHCDHDHDHHHHDHGHAHHTDDIAAFAFKSNRPFNTARLDEFLGGLINVYGPRMLRYKGVLWMDGADRKVIFQGVHQIMGSDIGAKWPEGEEKGSKMVFIGNNLPKDTFIRGLEQCLV